MKRFFDRLSSMPLAIALLVYLTVACILATIVPQGLSTETYNSIMPRLLAKLITETGFDHFFSSIAFFIPAFLFFANLSACTVKRFLKEVKKKNNKKHGPDILHLGLITLVLGAIWSFSGHKQGSVTLSPGEMVNLPDGSILKLHDFQFQRYEDGRPKDWISLLSIEKDGVPVKENYALRVNHPLRYKDLTFYQVNYSETMAVALLSSNGEKHILNQGEEHYFDNESFFYMAPSPEGDKAVIKISDISGDRVERVSKGDKLGSMFMAGFEVLPQSGIEASSDPGYPLVFLSLILIAIGTSWTFFQKLKEQK